MPRASYSAFRMKAEYLSLKVLLTLLSLVPESAGWRLGGVLGILWYALDGRRRRLAVGNIARASRYPWSRDPSRVARENFRHLARNAFQFARMSRMKPHQALAMVEWEGREHMAAALSRGKGVFLLTGHLGNWELMGAAISASGCSLSGVARAMNNPLTDKVINDIRISLGSAVIPHRHAVRSIMRTLGKGEAVAVLLDQNALRREAVFVEFMGRPAATHYAVAALARKTGTPVLPVFNIKTGPGKIVVRFLPEVPLVETADPQADLIANTARFTAVIEAAVAEHPEQWFWVHNRWRNQPNPGKP